MRPKEFTIIMQRAFLERLKKHRNVSLVCDLIGVCRGTVYYHRRTNEEFKRAWDNAKHGYGIKTINGFQV